jgi:cephalosporin-C deacetylase
MTPTFLHDFPFDPSYGHTLETLLNVTCLKEPEDFESFWKNRLERALEISPYPRLTEICRSHAGFHVHDVRYASTDGFLIGGWLLTPREGNVQRGLVVGHGYGGRDSPDFHLPVSNAAVLFPCFRGLSRSRRPEISDNPAFHVLHDIDRPDRYILGGCVEDLWLAVSSLLDLFPQIEGHIGYMGTSFGGGIGAMALAWDRRMQRAHLNVPSFGNQPLRLTLPTVGSGESVRRFEREHGHVMVTLQYYDAALAARRIAIPMHIAAALFDPVVAPPGQFAIYNALRGPKKLSVLDAGHFDYPARMEQEKSLLEDLGKFFDPL